MDSEAHEVLFNLYGATTDDGYARDVLDELAIDAGYAWECTDTLPDDSGLPCNYVNVPILQRRPADAPCKNCGGERPDDA